MITTEANGFSTEIRFAPQEDNVSNTDLEARAAAALTDNKVKSTDLEVS